ncbi:type II toxin-antitoxin system HicA family toxin [Scytonema sp. NUACC26]
MDKLRVLSGREVCKILEQYGFVQVRQRGSHIMMQRTIPVSL